MTSHAVANFKVSTIKKRNVEENRTDVCGTDIIFVRYGTYRTA
jgi:hypothetical protein